MSSIDLIRKLDEGNRKYLASCNFDLMHHTAVNGQHPYAIVRCCSDSRVIPDRIFSSDIGDLFVIRVAGNVLDNHQMGSIEYAASHLGCKLIVLLGHTGCGAVTATIKGESEGYITYITEDIKQAIGNEKDPDRACEMNVHHCVATIRKEFAQHPEIADATVRGAIYDIEKGTVRWLD